MRPGYYFDNDMWLYLTLTGKLYVVYLPDSMVPAWRRVGPSAWIDAQPATPDAEDLALFEQTRVASGISE